MTVLTTTREAAERAAPRATRAPIAPPRTVAKLPIVIDPPRGGVFESRKHRAAGMAAAAPSARDTVLRAIWPLVGAASSPAPGTEATAIADAAVARIRALIANDVTRFRARAGAAARSVEGADRVAIENWAIMLAVDEPSLLERMVGALSPQDLVAAAVAGRHAAADAVERTVARRVELHLLGLVQTERCLGETAKARLLFSLTATCG